MNHVFHLHWTDIVAFFSYILILSLVGWWHGRKKSTSQEYFLAGRSLPWYVVGSSYIASNISTEHFVAMMGGAVIYGICVATQEWSTVIAFSFMIWLFIPFLLTSKVYTAPEFLEKRFNVQLRVVFAIITIIANILVFMAPVIYGGSLILTDLFGVNKILAPVIIGTAAGAWAIWGGLKSVAFMDVITLIFKISGGIIVAIVGLIYLGNGSIAEGLNHMFHVNLAKEGWSAQWVKDHISHMLAGGTANDNYHRMSVLQPFNHKINPWIHWAFSFFYIGLWYTVINQHLIQKVFAAKDMYHARQGMVFASFLKLLVPVVVVLPGLIFFAMKPDFLFNSDWKIVEEGANHAYIVMVRDLVPLYIPFFLVGILMAAFFGAVQSTVCSALNSTSTIFTMDFYHKYMDKDASEKKIVKVGRYAGIVILLISIGFAILLGTALKQNLFAFIQAAYTFIGAPFSAVFLLGMLWKRVNGRDALTAIIVAFCVSLFLKFLEYGPLEDSQSYLAQILLPFANQGLITWATAMITCIISALVTPPPSAEQVGEGLVFNFKNKKILSSGLGTRWYNSVGLWWSIAFFLMIVIIFIFSVIVN